MLQGGERLDKNFPPALAQATPSSGSFLLCPLDGGPDTALGPGPLCAVLATEHGVNESGGGSGGTCCSQRPRCLLGAEGEPRLREAPPVSLLLS